MADRKTSGRVLAGLLGFLLAFGMISKSLGMLALALRLRASLPGNPGGHLEVQEAFITFALELTAGLALGWWGISKFRRPPIGDGQ